MFSDTEIEQMKTMINQGQLRQLFYYHIYPRIKAPEAVTEEQATEWANKCQEVMQFLESKGIDADTLNQLFIKKTNNKTMYQTVFDIEDGWDKQIENLKFGIELEYGGYDNEVSRTGLETAEGNNLIETIKDDCSVAGDGTEYNWSPMLYTNINANKKAMEAFMFKCANKRCTESVTAGNHVHMSAPNLTQIVGDYVQNTMRDILNRCGWDYRTMRKPVEETRYLEYCKSKINTEAPQEEQDKAFQETLKTRACYLAIQWLYSTSNRQGNECYGIGNDYSRGYTRHGTIELRVWRTTLDYRSVISRVRVAWMYVKWLASRIQLDEKGYIDWGKESIWDFVAKPENSDAYNAFKYLAFNTNNKHRCGLSEIDLETRLNVTHQCALAIKERSRLIKDSLKINSNRSKAKELFKLI